MLVFLCNALSLYIFIQLLSAGQNIGGLGYTTMVLNILIIIGCLINVTIERDDNE